MRQGTSAGENQDVPVPATMCANVQSRDLYVCTLSGVLMQCIGRINFGHFGFYTDGQSATRGLAHGGL